MSWSWETGTPRERAKIVRQHQDPKLSRDDLCRLFRLTRAGLSEILSGKDWRPEYSYEQRREPPNSSAPSAANPTPT